MRRILTAILLFLPLLLRGQDYETQGDNLYVAGNYEEAELQYKAAKALMDSRKIDENSPEYLSLEKKIVRTGRLKALKAEADALYSTAVSQQSRASYSQAAEAYSRILEGNPEDPSALSGKSRCREWITGYDRAAERERVLAEQRREEQRRQRESEALNRALVSVLKENDTVTSMLDATGRHIAAIPEGHPEDRAFAEALKHYISDGFGTVSEDSIAIYNRMGDLFLEAGKPQIARDLYDCSASLADPEGLYKKAMTAKSKTRQDIFYLLLASKAGYQQAADSLKDYVVYAGGMVASRFAIGFDDAYSIISTYRTDPEAALYLYALQKGEQAAVGSVYNTGFSHCNIDITETLQAISPEQLKSWIGKYTSTQKGDWLSWFYSVGLNCARHGDDSLAVKLITVAAQDGNHTASQWLEKKSGKTGQDTEEDVFIYDFSRVFKKIDEVRNLKTSAWDGSITDYQAQLNRARQNNVEECIRYIKGDKSCDVFDACSGFYHIGFDNNIILHENLILRTMYYRGSNYKFAFERLQKLIKNSSKVWDADVVRECIEMCEGNTEKKKGLKLLQKLDTAEGIYDRRIIEQFRKLLLEQSAESDSDGKPFVGRIFYNDKADGEIYSIFDYQGKVKDTKPITSPPPVKGIMGSFSYKDKSAPATVRTSSASRVSSSATVRTSSAAGSSATSRSSSASGSTGSHASSTTGSGESKPASANTETVQLSETDRKIVDYYKSKKGTRFSQTCYRSGGGVDTGFPIEYTLEYEGNGVFLLTFTQRYNTYKVKGQISDGRLVFKTFPAGLRALSVAFRKDKKTGKYWISGSYEKGGHFPVRF